MAIKLPITPERLEKRTMFQRFLGTDAKENAFAQAKNLVIQGNLDQSAIEQLGSEYDLDIPHAFKVRWLELFREVMTHLFEDGIFDADEKEFAKEYISIFRLERHEVDQVLQQVGRQVYVDRIIRLAGPDGLTDAQHEELDRLAIQLGLRNTQSAYKDTVSEVLKLHIQSMLSDSFLSPDEMAKLKELCHCFRVDAVLDPITKQRLEAARNRWNLLTDLPEPINVSDLRLGENETVYHDEFGEWYETRMIRRGGQSASRYKSIHAGRIVLTNTRLLLIAESGSNKTLKWKSLLAVNTDGQGQVELVKERGKSPIIKYFEYHDIQSDGPLIARRLFQGTG